MQVDSKPLNIVLDGGETKIDQVNDFPFDEDIVARQITVRCSDSVKPSYGGPNPMQDGLHLFSGGGSIVENFDEWSSAKVFDDELSTFVIEVPNRGYRKARFSSSNKQPCLTDHPSNTQPVIEVWVAPRSWSSLLTDGWLSKPFPSPNFSLSAEVQALVGFEDHAPLTKAFFLNVHAHPFLQKGLMFG
tara:strand:+ start:1182 stop:1745 length:564 start_codon:yes stop_codon:yes gene_type:complete